MAENGGIVKEIKEKCRKQEPSLQFKLNLDKLFIGNYEMKLVPNSKFTVQQNHSRKMSFRFHIQKDPLVGYDTKDIGLAITQLESISIKDEECENPPIIMLKLKLPTKDKLFATLPGLKERLNNLKSTESFIFVMKPWENDPDCYCKATYAPQQEHKLDFEQVISVFTQDIHAVWNLMRKEKSAKYKSISLADTVQLVSVMDSVAWIQALENVKLEKRKDANGSVFYAPHDERRISGKVANGFAKRQLAHNDYDRVQKKRPKASEPEIGQLVLSVPKSRKGRRVLVRVEQLTRYVISQSNDHLRQIYYDKKMVKSAESRAKMMKHKKIDEKKVHHTKFNLETVASTQFERQVEEVEQRMENLGRPARIHQYPVQPYHQQLQKSPIKEVQMHQFPPPPLQEKSPVKLMQILPYPQQSPIRQRPVIEFQSPSDYVQQQQQQQQEMMDYQQYPQPYQHQNYQNQNQQNVYQNYDEHLIEMQMVQEEEGQEQVQEEQMRSEKMPEENDNIRFVPQIEVDPVNVQNDIMDEAEMAEFITMPPSRDNSSHDVRQQGDNGEVQMETPQVAEVQPQPIAVQPPQQVARVAPQLVVPQNQRRVDVSGRRDQVMGDTVLLSFPPKGLAHPGIDPVLMIMKDVRTLDRAEFVNDNIMSFMLNYIVVYRIDKQLMSTIHLCNTFFYSTLTRYLPSQCFSKRKPIDETLQSTLVSNCIRMLRWTKKFDVFTKDYIVIPINEDYHWLLITIFNPSGAIVDLADEKNSRNAPKCYVAFFDPLSGLEPSKRNHMCHCIMTYLEQLYINTKAPGTKFGGKRHTIYDPSRVIVTLPKGLPIQKNFYDCGLYVLSFIEGLFCYLNKPITVHDFPDFDWSQRYPAATDMAELMRDKIYNLILRVATPENKRRLSRFEKSLGHGLSQEGKLRRGRRHSADRKRRVPRHEEYRPRRYSVSTRERLLIETPLFMNPRDWAEMPCTIKVRSLRWPEENFPCIY